MTQRREMICAIQYSKYPNKVRWVNTKRQTAPCAQKPQDSDGGRLQADSELKLSRVTVWRSQIWKKDHNDHLKFK